MSSFSDTLAQHQEVVRALAGIEESIRDAAERLQHCLAGGGKVLLCGNGGSAADAQHIAAELVVRYTRPHRPALAALALTTDSSILTAHSNDYEFESVFARQVEALGRPGDCLVAISTSGGSANVCRAAEAARAAGMTVIALAGHDGGRLAGLADRAVVVPSAITARVQEAHILIAHWWCDRLEREAAGR